MADPVQQHRQALSREAYANIVKYIAVANKSGKESMALLSTLRNTFLHIDQATHKDVLQEATRFKQLGGAVAAGPPAYGGGGGYGMQQQGSFSMPGGGGPAAAGPKAGARGPKQGGAPGAGGPAAAQSKAKAAAKPLPKPKGELPPYIGYMVQRYWDPPADAAEGGGGWYTACITDFDPASNEYVLTYNLGNPDEEFEKVNLEMLGPQYIQYKERIDLVAQWGDRSTAVQNSSVLKPYLAAAGKGKKRKSDDMF